MKSIAAGRLRHDVHLIDHDLPPIQSGEVVVRTLETGICSTDRELLSEGILSTPDGDDFLVLGHEALGEVLETGPGVTTLSVGDLVVPTVRRGCGICDFCKNGRSDMCSTGGYKERGIIGLHGFMSEKFIEEETNLVKIPERIRRYGVLLEPMSVAIKAIEESALIQSARLYPHRDIDVKRIFRKALIIGAGPIGLLTALAMIHHDVTAFCADIDEHGGTKSTLVEDMGGHYLNLKRYQKNNGMDLDRIRTEGGFGEVDIIVDASSHPLTCFQLMDVLAPNGIAAILGLPHKTGVQKIKPDELMARLVMKNHIVLGSVNSNKTHFEKTRHYLEAMESKHEAVLSGIVSHRLPFSDFQEAFRIEERDRIKVVISWE